MKPEFSDTEYRFSHGKSPRGRGHWAFFFDGAEDVDSAFWHAGTYAEAKAAAMAEAKRRGARKVVVGS